MKKLYHWLSKVLLEKILIRLIWHLLLFIVFDTINFAYIQYQLYIIFPNITIADEMLFGPRQTKKCLRTCVNCAISAHSAHAQSIIWACSPFIHSVVPNDFISGQ